MNKKKATSPPTTRFTDAAIQHAVDLQRWYDSRQGRYALDDLHAAVQEMTADVFGYYALEMGLLVDRCNLLVDSRISTRVKMSANPLALGVDAFADAEALPVAIGNVDLVVACHVLDYAHSPHQVLREIERVLVPDGHCVLIGFNPLSFRGMGLAGKWLRGRQGVPSVYTGFRIRDWFSVLGFEIIEMRTLSFRPGWGGERLFRRLEWLERMGKKYQLPVGNLQVIHVRKQVSRLTPIKSTRRTSALLQPGMAVNSSTSRVTRLDTEHKE